MKELTQRRNLDFKKITKKIKSDGMAEIDNFLDEDTVKKLQNLIIFLRRLIINLKDIWGALGKRILKALY